MKNIAETFAGVAVLAAMSMIPLQGDACSRVIYKGLDNLFVVGRSLDWKTPIPTNLYVYPRGMSKQSTNLDNPIKWQSKYGAVYAVGYDGGVTEGMNEKGLVVNGLFCKGTVYNDTVAKPFTMSLAVFPAWLLDTCATIDDVKAALQTVKFDIQGATFDGGTVSALHWGVTDASGRSIIFEFDHGRVDIYDMGDYQAMTNDPEWPQMKAIIDYWEKIGGRNMLPGTVSSPDRCVRANYFARHVEPTSDPDLAVAITRSVIVPSCVPYTYLVEGEPNVSSTQWRSYSNTRDLRYYFDMAVNPGYYYIDLKALDLRPGRSVLKLDTSDTKELVGCANGRLVKSDPFTPMY